MKDISAAIKYDLFDACLDPAFRDQLADDGSCFNVRTGAAALILLQRRSGRERPTIRIVYDLGVDVFRRTMHRKARAITGNLLDLTTDALRSLLC
jgi:hypothetical protein